MICPTCGQSLKLKIAAAKLLETLDDPKALREGEFVTAVAYLRRVLTDEA